MSWLFGIFKKKKQRNGYKYVNTDENGIVFIFESDVELCEKDIPNVVEIINENTVNSIPGDVTVRRVFEELQFSTPEISAIDISSEDYGNTWLIRVSAYPRAFRH